LSLPSVSGDVRTRRQVHIACSAARAGIPYASHKRFYPSTTSTVFSYSCDATVKLPDFRTWASNASLLNSVDLLESILFTDTLRGKKPCPISYWIEPLYRTGGHKDGLKGPFLKSLL
jgi:hypothetical protein